MRYCPCLEISKISEKQQQRWRRGQKHWRKSRCTWSSISQAKTVFQREDALWSLAVAKEILRGLRNDLLWG